MSTEDRANPDNVKLLRVVYHRLLNAQSNVMDAIMADGRGDDPYEVFAPLPSGQRGLEARVALAKSIKNVFGALQDDGSEPLSGLVCASPETIAAVVELNSAKEELKSAVAHIKKTEEAGHGSAGFRPVELQRVMKEVGFAATDLKRVYANIRILEAGVHRVSWTWAVNHRTYKPISPDVLERRLAGLEQENPSAAELARDRLSKAKDPRPATLYSLPDQLRVNYSFGEKGSRVNKGYPVSGVLVVPQKSLPIVKWVDRDSHRRRAGARKPAGGVRKELLPGWGVYYHASA
ncbi:hypothetical protein [Spongiibacter sp.]|uniref:hypothetical protein n=1 Tax=Spongiibacter sp. TaxID=2024860 RepID=UPI000C5B18D6|nr:hypothetical protein [Spongiibacter sp.]MAY37863.1 hypothetical protein [Spongiibacter sp.]|tara:strand:+ start:785 stop:1657 length:873 start_codon:yes stop_codon:yes gene_type:complete